MTSTTIIVVTYNSQPFLARQMAALKAQTTHAWHLVVIDNASAPDQRPRAEDLLPGTVFIQSETNNGFAGANNQVARRVHTEFIALLNPDAFPEPTWLEELLGAAERWPNAAAFGSLQLSASGGGKSVDDGKVLDGAGDMLHALGFPYRAMFGRPLQTPLAEGETFSTCAAAALYRRTAFLNAGGFDESFFCYCEDVDLGYRLRLRGLASIQAPSAIVTHVGGGSSDGSRFAEYHGARNRFWMFVKSTPAILFWPLLPFHIAATLLLLSARSFQGRGHGQWRGFSDALARFPHLLGVRRHVQAQRIARIRDIARALTWNPLNVIARKPARSSLPKASFKRGGIGRPGPRHSCR